jgi:chromosome segregation ATPase
MAVASPAQTTPEIAADVLAIAVEKAVKLERERSDRETDLAVKAATEKANLQHQLNDHEGRLNAINGSIVRTGMALTELKDTVVEHYDKQEKRNEKWDTEQEVHWRRAGQAFSKRQMVLAWIAVLATASAASIADLVKAMFGG